MRGEKEEEKKRKLTIIATSQKKKKKRDLPVYTREERKIILYSISTFPSSTRT